MYADDTTDEEIEAGTATTIGYIECGEVPQDLADMFDLTGYAEEWQA